MTRDEILAEASEARSQELAQCQPGPGFIRETDEVFERYHQKIFEADKIKFDSDSTTCYTVLGESQDGETAVSLSPPQPPRGAQDA